MSTSTPGLISPPNPLATSTPGTMSALDQSEHRMTLDQSETPISPHDESAMSHQNGNPKITKLEETGSGSDSGNDVRSPSSSSHLTNQDQSINQGQSQSPSNQSNGSSGFGESQLPVGTSTVASTVTTTPPATAQPFFTPYSTGSGVTTGSGSSHSFYSNQGYPYVPLDMAPYQNYSNIYANQTEF